jgi:hypothetical protein
MSFFINPFSYGVGAPPATDPNFANTIVLLSGDGTNGSQVFPDESAAGRGNAGFGANASVETLTSKVFGTGSIRFSAITGAWLSYADHADFTLGTSDFTIELFVRFDGNATVQSIASHWGAAGQRGSSGATISARRICASSGLRMERPAFPLSLEPSARRREHTIISAPSALETSSGFTPANRAGRRPCLRPRPTRFHSSTARRSSG